MQVRSAMAHPSGSWSQGSVYKQQQLFQHGLPRHSPVASRHPSVCRHREATRPIRHSAGCTHAALAEPSCPPQLSLSLSSSLPRQAASAQTVGESWGSSRQRSQARALTKAIKGCHHWRELYALLAMQDSKNINSVHVAAAMHHCTLILQKGGMSAIDQRDMQAWLNQYLLPKAKQQLHIIRARELVTILHAIASLHHIPHASWLIASCETVQQLMPTFTSRDSASCLWALSHILQCVPQQQQQPSNTGQATQGSHTSRTDGELFHACVKTTVSQLLMHNLQHIRSANSQDVANVLFAAGTLQTLGLNLVPLPMNSLYSSSYSKQHSPESADDASQMSTAHMQPFQLNGCSRIGGSHSSSGLMSWHTWHAAYLQASVHLLHSCDAHALSNIAWGLHNMSRAGALIIANNWKSTFQHAVTAQLSNSCPQGLVALLSALPALGWQQDSQWVMQLLSAMESLLPECSLQDLCDVGRAAPGLMQACMAQGIMQQSSVNRWWQTFEGVAVARLRYAQPKHYALLLCCIAHANRKCDAGPAHATLLAWFNGASACITSWSSLDAAQALAAMAALRLTPHAQFMESLLLSIRKSAQPCRISHSVGILQALAHMQYNPGWQFMLYMYDSTAKTPTQQHDSQLTVNKTALLQMMLRVDGNTAMVSTSANGLSHRNTLLSQHHQQPSLMQLSSLISSVVRLKQRPMAEWVQWLLAALPGTVSSNMPVLQGSHAVTSKLVHSIAMSRPYMPDRQLLLHTPDHQAAPQTAARAIAETVYGLVRLHIVPPASLLKQLLDAATASVQYLSPSQSLMLLSCTARLFQNCRSTALQPGMHHAKERRSKLLQRSLRVMSNGQQCSLPQARRKGDHSTHSYKAFVRRLKASHNTTRVRKRLRQRVSSSQNAAVNQAGLSTLAKRVLAMTEPRMRDLTMLDLNQLLLCTAFVVQALPEISRSQLRSWLHAWLLAHQAAHATQCAAQQELHKQQGNPHVKTTRQRQASKKKQDTVTRLQRSDMSGYLLLSSLAKLLPLACMSNKRSQKTQDYAVLTTAEQWLLAYMPAMHAASCIPCPVSLLPALVDLAEMCDCLEAASPIVQRSLFHAMKGPPGDDAQHTGTEQRMPGKLSGLPLLQLAYSVVRTGIHRSTLQAQQIEQQGTGGFTTDRQADICWFVSQLVLGLQLVVDQQQLLQHHRQIAGELVLELQTTQPRARL